MAQVGSHFATAVSAAGFAKGELQVLFQSGPQRMIFGSSGPPITNYITLLEEGEDELQITEHPVEQGTTISDHAYKLPARLNVRIVFTPASQNEFTTPFGAIPFSGFFQPGSIFSYGSAAAYLSQIYNTFLTLQQQRSLLQVITGKRAYSNMLVRSIGVSTDERTENVLMLSVGFREILLAQTQAVQTPTSEDPSALANPQANQPAISQGTQQLQPGSLFQSSVSASVAGG